MTVKASLAVLFARIATMFGIGKKDDSAFDAQRVRLKKVQQQSQAVDEEAVVTADAKSSNKATDGKLKVALRPPAVSVPAPQSGNLKDKNTREQEIAKMTGLSVPQNYQGPGGAVSGSTGETDNFKHWLSGQ